MYDLSTELEIYFNDHVKLSEKKIEELYEKKRYNLDRLERGLEKYNDNNDTDYSLVDSYVQGSVGMGTVTQSEENDYDIDVGILIDEENIDDIGSSKIKNVILGAFEEINANFNTPPKKLTNCIRFTYLDGYQIDFAVYRKIINAEHAGSEWRERNPDAIQGWFDLSKLVKGDFLPIIVQLLKMFNKSRNSWVMPGGLVTTILVEECLASQYDKLDEVLYHTIENIVNRLNNNEDVKTPVFPHTTILYTNKDSDRVNNFRKRLKKQLDKLDVLLEYDCTKLDAIEAWQSFFNHTYWDKLYSEEEQKMYDSSKVADYTEEYIDEQFPVNLRYEVRINAIVDASGFRPDKLSSFLKNIRFIPKDKKIDFYIESINTPEPYDIYWKVRNVGEIAYRRNQIRGKIIKTNSDTQTETSNFKGRHYVECYIIKDGICVAKDKINVPI